MDKEINDSFYELNGAVVKAGFEVSKLNQSFNIGCETLRRKHCEFDSWKDKESINLNTWLESISKIKSLDPSEERMVIGYLCQHVLIEWENLPKRTAKEHSDYFKKISETCNKLINLLDGSGDFYYRSGGYGLAKANVADLLTAQEARAILQPLNAYYSDSVDQGYHPGADFPRMEELLERISSAANRLEKTGPMHSQPNKKGAINGFFVRKINLLLIQRYEVVPISIIASIASFFLGEVIDDDLARKHINNPERSKDKIK